MFTAAEVARWGPEDALDEVKERIPLGWKITLGTTGRYAFVELYNENGDRVWLGSNHDPKLLYLEALGWLLTRNHKIEHPVWKPREREVTLRVPNPESHDPDPPDLDPEEIAAVYRNRR